MGEGSLSRFFAIFSLTIFFSFLHHLLDAGETVLVLVEVDEDVGGGVDDDQQGGDVVGELCSTWVKWLTVKMTG